MGGIPLHVMLRKAQRKILGRRVYANPGCMFLGNGSAICKNMSAVQENCCVFVYNILHACARGTAVRYVQAVYKNMSAFKTELLRGRV